MIPTKASSIFSLFRQHSKIFSFLLLSLCIHPILYPSEFGVSLFTLAPLGGIIQRLDQIPHSSLWHLYEELSRDLIRFLTLHCGTSTRNYPETLSGSSLLTLEPLRGIIQRLEQVPHSSLWHLYEELSRDLSRFLTLHFGTSTRNYPVSPMYHWYNSPGTSPQHGPQSHVSLV